MRYAIAVLQAALKRLPKRCRRRAMLRRARRNGNSWMITYADLMSLLLCFFVMLVSFSEMDRVRFKEMAGQLSQAFGVQRDLPADRIFMGTSAALENFSPGEDRKSVV